MPTLVADGHKNKLHAAAKGALNRHGISLIIVALATPHTNTKSPGLTEAQRPPIAQAQPAAPRHASAGACGAVHGGGQIVLLIPRRIEVDIAAECSAVVVSIIWHIYLQGLELRPQLLVEYMLKTS